MPLHAVQARNEENLRQIEEARQQIAALRTAYETKANWIGFFADLQNRLVKVEDVWLEKLLVNRGPLPEPGPPPADGAPPARRRIAEAARRAAAQAHAQRPPARRVEPAVPGSAPNRCSA